MSRFRRLTGAALAAILTLAPALADAALACPTTSLASNFVLNGGANPQPATTGANVPVGDTIICVTASDSNFAQASSISDLSGNTWTAGGISTDGGFVTLKYWWANVTTQLAAAAGAISVTWTRADEGRGIQCWDVPGLGGEDSGQVIPPDNRWTTVNPVTTTTGTLNHASALVFVTVFGDQNSATTNSLNSSGSGFTDLAGWPSANSHGAMMTACKAVSATTAVAYSGNVALVNNQWSVWDAYFATVATGHKTRSTLPTTGAGE